jgi:outer membrane protein assembly factor BamE (lipoprotein component of BamABCDE complex)
MIKDIKNLKTFSILFYVFFLCGLIYYFFTPDSFNKKNWEDNVYSRYEQVDYILKSKMLIGKSKKEVINLLGKPDENDFDKNEWIYSTSDAGSFGSAPSGFKIVFNNEKVKYNYKEKY